MYLLYDGLLTKYSDLVKHKAMEDATVKRMPLKIDYLMVYSVHLTISYKLFCK